MRRALILALVLAAVPAAAAQARPSLFVQASASGVATADGQMRLTVQCAAADVKNAHFGLSDCSVGPVAAETYCGFECPGKPVAYATGTAPLGSYQLCVRAYSWGTYAQHFHRCVALDPTTNTAVITG